MNWSILQMVNVGFVLFVMASVVISLRWSSQAIRQLYRLKSYDLLELERNLKEALDRVDNAIEVMREKSVQKTTESVPVVESAMGGAMDKKDLYQEILSNLKKADRVNLSQSVGAATNSYGHQSATGKNALGQAVERRRYEEAMGQRNNPKAHQNVSHNTNNYNAIKERLAKATEQAKREELRAREDQQARQRVNPQRSQQYDQRDAQPYAQRDAQRYGQDDRYSNVTPLNIVSGSRSPMPVVQREEDVARLLSADRTDSRSNRPLAEEGYRRAYLGR